MCISQLQGNRCDKILRAFSFQTYTGWSELIYPFQDNPYNCNLHLQIAHCLLNFSMSVFSFFLFSRDSSRLTSAISTTNSSYEIYIVHVEITVSCDTLIELATLSNLYFSTLSSILHVHTIVYYPLPLIAR